MTQLLLYYISPETYPSAEITDYPFGLNSVQNPTAGKKKKKGIRFSDLTSEELNQHFEVFTVTQKIPVFYEICKLTNSGLFAT